MDTIPAERINVRDDKIQEATFKNNQKVICFNQFNHEYRRISGIIGLTYREKTIECENIFHIFQRLCTMVDLAADIFTVERARMPYYVCHLTLRNYLEMRALLVLRNVKS